MVYGPTNSGKTFTMQGEENEASKVKSPIKIKKIVNRPGSSLGIARRESPLKGQSNSKIKVFKRKMVKNDDFES